MDNKKLTKILGISLGALLLLVILIRLAVKSRGEQSTELPNVSEEITYDPKMEQEKSKSQIFDEEKQKENEKMYGGGENNYVVPNFNELTPEQKAQQSISSASTPTTPTNQYEPSSVNIKSTNNNNSGLNYESDYFKKAQTENNSTTQQPVQQPVTKNPFGTVKTGSNTGGGGEVNVSAQLKAEIYGDQKIADGGAVNLRSIDAFPYNGITIPKNSILFGQARYSGNRVLVTIHRAKTPQGEQPINMSLLDNDRIEGIFYKAPVDEATEKTQDNTDIPVGGTYGKILNKVGNTVVNESKDLMKKSRALVLEDGYIVYLIYPKK